MEGNSPIEAEQEAKQWLVAETAGEVWGESRAPHESKRKGKSA
jgi:hypothetical protein